MHMICFHQATQESTSEEEKCNPGNERPFLTPEGTCAELRLSILIWTVETHAAYFIHYFYFFAYSEMHKFTI